VITSFFFSSVHFILFLFFFFLLHLLTCVYIGPTHCPSQLSPQAEACSVIFWKENFIRYNKKDVEFLLVWDKDSYTESFLALYLCIATHIGSLPPDLFTTSWSVASDSLRLLHSSTVSMSITFKFLVSFPFLIHPLYVLPFVWDPCLIILLHLFWVYNPHMKKNMWFLAFWA
jgi:hypothetical protein